jgi:predicted RNA-binding Zn-ribbon protein involved in translation (DUF1610 family)
VVIAHKNLHNPHLSSVAIPCPNCGAHIYVPYDTLLDAGSTFRCPWCLLDTIIGVFYPAQYATITLLLEQKAKLEQERNELVKLYGEADLKCQQMQERLTVIEEENIKLIDIVNDHLEHNEWLNGVMMDYMEERKCRLRGS